MGRSRSRSASRGRSRSRGGGGGAGRGGGSILVRNLDYDISPDEIRDIFGKCGKIKDVYLPLEYGSRKPKGFGFIEFVNPEDAEFAVRSMDNEKIKGKVITVIVAQDRRKSPRTMKRRQGRDHDYARGWEQPKNHWAANLPLREPRKDSRRKDSRRRRDSRRR